MAVFSDTNEMVARETRATDREGGREWLVEQITSVINGWKRRYQWQRCGIGFGGPVDFASQRVVLSTHVGGWTGFDPPGFIGEQTGVPVVMDNDANVGALGEGTYGPEKMLTRCST